ncbi:MAG: hypothetical protein GXP01_00265 [Alphaproteobacteria bacterium]|nr:hypothetical protein [Alphaproteobacteria bacterium]
MHEPEAVSKKKPDGKSVRQFRLPTVIEFVREQPVNDLGPCGGFWQLAPAAALLASAQAYRANANRLVRRLPAGTIRALSA